MHFLHGSRLTFAVTSLGQPMEVLKTHVRSAKDICFFTLILTPLRSPPIGATLLLILCGKHGVEVVSVDSTRASYHGFVPSPIAAALSKANKY